MGVIYWPRFVVSLLALVLFVGLAYRAARDARVFRRNGTNGAIALTLGHAARMAMLGGAMSFVIVLSAFEPHTVRKYGLVLFTVAVLLLVGAVQRFRHSSRVEIYVADFISQKEQWKVHDH